MGRLHISSCLLLFALSGAAGLIYEASWTRQLGLVLGFTGQATAVVLAAWFVGLAAGSWFGARWMLGRPLAGYAVAELVAGSWALAVPWLLARVELWAGAQAGLGLRAAACLVVLLPATICLGATLPWMAQHLCSYSPRPALINRAYALNIAGGVVGLLAATFGLLCSLGVQNTGSLAAAISLCCGVAALLLSRGRVAHGENASAALPGAPISMRWYFIAALGGALTIGLQVLYLRLFARVLHNSSYTFGAVVACFLVALALGSWLVARWLDRGRISAESLVRRAAAVAAVSLLATALLFVAASRLALLDPPGGFGLYIIATLGFVGLIVGVPVTAAGMLLPATWSAALAKTGRGGRTVGRLAAVNVLAAAAGALLFSFVLLGRLGLWGCLVLVAAGYLALALLPSRRAPVRPLPAVATLLACCAVLGWLLLSAPHRFRRAGEQQLASWNTTGGLIEVVRDQQQNIKLVQNAHYIMGDTASRDSERNQGHLPLLLHPRPARVLFVGLATGITASAALEHPRLETVVVELIPEVLAAARLFHAHNGRLDRSPGAQLVVDDARHFLRRRGPRFDVIVSDLFVPWHSRTGYLYTVEHYRAASRRLRAGGLLVQWISLAQVGPRELRLIASSLAAAFAQVTVWREPLDPRKICLVGSQTPLPVQPARLEQRLVALAHPPGSVARPRLRASDLRSLCAGHWDAGDDPLNTDEHPRVEFGAPVTQRLFGVPLARRLRNFDELLSRLRKRKLNARTSTTCGCLCCGDGG